MTRRWHLLALLVRRHGPWIAVWTAIDAVLTAGTLPSYSSTYPTEAARRAAVQIAQQDAATTLLYGRLPDPGTPAQLFAWEIGTFLTLLAAVAGVLLGVRLTRAAEEAGTTELLRSCGLQARDVLAAGLVVLIGAAAALGLATGLGVVAHAGRVEGVDVQGAAVLGGVVAVTFSWVALITVVLAQALPSTQAARAAGGIAVGAALIVRAAADTQDLPALQWLSPLALRAVTRPFGADRPLALLPAVLACAAMAVLALLVERHRELGSALLPARVRDGRRLRVRTATGLAWRRQRTGVAAWSVGVAAGGAMFTAMGAGVVTSAREGRLSGGLLAEQLAGADPASAYFAYTATVVGIAVAVMAVLTVQRAAEDEGRGLTEHLRAAGVAPSAPLTAQVIVAVLGALIVLVVTAAADGLVAPHVITGGGIAREAFMSTLAQAPAVATLTGITALVTAVLPRWAALAWAPFGVAVAVTMLGGLLDVPRAIVDLSVFGHAHGGTAPSVGAVPQTVLVAVGLASAVVAATLVRRRDLSLG